MSEMTHAKDLRQRTEEELRAFAAEKADELLKLRFQQATGQLENVARVAAVKREVARAKTLLRERELGAAE